MAKRVNGERRCFGCYGGGGCSIAEDGHKLSVTEQTYCHYKNAFGRLEPCGSRSSA